MARINDEVGTITGAAFETAAQSIRTVLYHLYSNPEMLQHLRSELASSQKEDNGQISLTVLENLPYLTSVIREGLRLSPGLATRLARIAPDRDISYGQWTIPAGTPVGMTGESTVHRMQILVKSQCLQLISASHAPRRKRVS